MVGKSSAPDLCIPWGYLFPPCLIFCIHIISNSYGFIWDLCKDLLPLPFRKRTNLVALQDVAENDEALATLSGESKSLRVIEAIFDYRKKYWKTLAPILKQNHLHQVFDVFPRYGLLDAKNNIENFVYKIRYKFSVIFVFFSFFFNLKINHRINSKFIIA